MALLFGTAFCVGAINAQYMQFDIKADYQPWYSESEPVAETKCKVCVWQSGKGKVCANGVEHGPNRTTLDLRNGWDSNRDTFVDTDCGDAMWIDRFKIVEGTGTVHYWGRNNNYGYCLSRERGDWNAFNANVHTEACYYQFNLRPGGTVTGWIAPLPSPKPAPAPVEYDYMVTPVKTWKDAEDYCQWHGGHLASVHSKEEDERVAAFMRKHTTSKYPWLGGYSTSANTPGTYKWSDGTAWDYMNPTWYRNDGHPNYVHYYRSNVWGTWCPHCKSQGVCAIEVSHTWTDHPRGRRRAHIEERLAPMLLEEDEAELEEDQLEEREYLLDDGEPEEDQLEAGEYFFDDADQEGNQLEKGEYLLYDAHQEGDQPEEGWYFHGDGEQEGVHLLP